jgi:hypothetical protein
MSKESKHVNLGGVSMINALLGLFNLKLQMCNNCMRNKINGGNCDTSRSNGGGCFLFVDNTKDSIDYGSLFCKHKHQKRVDVYPPVDRQP